MNIAADSIPNRLITIRNSDLPWITTEIRKLMRKRDRFRKKAKKLKSPYFQSKFKQCRNRVVDLLRNARMSYHENICKKICEENFLS